MVTVKSNKAFENLQRELDAKVCNKIRSYYDKNWHPIKDEWFTGVNFMVENFNTTNNQCPRWGHFEKRVAVVDVKEL